ncbi:MAG: hypothetical protein Q7J68_05490 [Thermoplasmata archaeon]|nr:hypothetical protein [Thermoplasmata archaeon]
MFVDIESLKEQAQYLNACLERLRSNMDTYPDIKEAKWLESMMVSSLIALDHHIHELERLGIQNYSPNKLFKK